MKSFFSSFGFLLVFLLLINISKIRILPSEDILQSITNDFHSNMVEVQAQITDYVQLANELTDHPTATENLRSVHKHTRLAYKNVEFFLEYFDREGVKKHINGAPLPRVEPHVPEVRIINPSGLQTLDELIFSEDPFSEKETIVELITTLQKKYNQTYLYQKGIQLQHRYVFEALRQELIRIFTLGVTGFDTPGSGNAIPEAIQALRGTEQVLNYYHPLLEKKSPVLQKNIATLFSATFQYLESNQDFNSFDRLEFLKSYINPLYALLFDAQIQLEIETVEETTNFLQPVNYQAKNLFGNDFLNKYYYANISPQHLTQERIELGKTLFFDPILSGNNERSCASCHHPEKAFTDGNDKSLAFNGHGTIARNAPTLINSVFAERYFHDLREPDIERQISHVIEDSMEFNTDFLEIIDKLNQSEAYKALFAKAYEDQPKYQLSKWSISDALACYITSLSSFNSPFDQYVRGESENIAPEVINGFNLFMGKAACGTCHFAPSFSGIVPPIYEESESEVLGVPMTTNEQNPEIDPDLGRFMSLRPHDEAPFYAFSFKTPTVRNIELTAPYMHNGVYHTLEEVIDFYNKGGGIGLGIDVPYQTLPDAPLELTDKEINDLTAFMNALTDTTGMTNIPVKLPEFESNPQWNDRKPGGVY